MTTPNQNPNQNSNQASNPQQNPQQNAPGRDNRGTQRDQEGRFADEGKGGDARKPASNPTDPGKARTGQTGGREEPNRQR